MDLTDGRQELFAKEACLLSDGILHHKCKDWYEKMFGAHSYTQLKLPELETCINGYEEELTWWQHPNVHTTKSILDEMVRSHSILENKRKFLNSSKKKDDESTEEKRFLFNGIFEASYTILQCARRKILTVPDDGFGKEICGQVDNIAPNAKYKWLPSETKKTKVDLKGDESLVTVAIYRCLTGNPTGIVTRDSDIKRLTRKALERLSYRFSTGETLNEFPLRIYFVAPHDPSVKPVYDSNKVRRTTVSQPTSSAGTSR